MSKSAQGTAVSKREIITVEAFDEQTARREALEQWMKRFGIGNQFPGLNIWVRLAVAGDKGFLGVGRKPNLYEVEVVAKELPEPSTIQVTMSSKEPIECLRDLINRMVAEGFYGESEIIESMSEISEDEYPGLDLQTQIAQAVQAALAQHREDEAQWQGFTDCDRLNLAFSNLELKGIVARQNFTCCQTCGRTEIGDEIRQAQEGREVMGYTFYHMQDTESAAEGHGLHLAYGAVSDDPDDGVKVGYQIVDELRQAGLKPEWGGDLKRRIFVPLDWKRRRYTTPA